MTRTALLQLLDHPTAIAPAEVQELEQLARAFPYCQTAHLLLAKAAHDQGTMLASQRLRRAATYAADRTLLRQLIEQTVEEPEVESIEPDQAPELTEAVVSEPLVQLVIQPEPASIEITSPTPEIVVPVAIPLAVPPAVAVAPEAAPMAAVTELPPASTELLAAALAAAEPIVSKIQKFNINHPVIPTADNTETIDSEALLDAAAPTEAPVAEPVNDEVADAKSVSAAEPESVVAESIETTATPGTEEITEAVEIIEVPPLGIEATPATEEAPAESAALADPTPTTPEPALELPEPETPATAPPIRPPDEVGSARFEFGLQDELKPASPLYELPLVDEWASAATPLALAGSDDLAFPPVLPSGPAAPKWTEAAFTGDAALGYALDEGSRLGFGLGLLTEALLEKIQAEHESLLAHEIVAAPRPAVLPPPEAFFEPDVLLLEHWAEHRPVAPPTPSSSELINSFLRRQPRLTRPAMLPPSPTAQADLSVKSTRPEPELISEGLARILARQGKIDRAIEIYQRLMVKQPEKMAYFAAQIQQLQPSA